MRSIYFIFTALALLSSSTQADLLLGKVTGVADGDSLYVLDAQQRAYRVRLLGIDAPEHGQAFGKSAKQALKQHIHKQPVRIEWKKRDQYGRLLGKITTANGEDVALRQISTGMAWWNRKYAYEQTDDDAIRYREAEAVARMKRAGLWSQENPIPPWRWRYAKPRQTDTVKP